MEIEQVVINLVSNALDATRNKADRWVRISVFESTTGAFLRVMDSGNGISKEAFGKLFEPFFTTKAVGEGTGLGLSICKGILETHGATIRVVEDSPNTCFEVQFPRVEEIEKIA